MSTTSASGKCLCGAVEVMTETLNTDAGTCHCHMCRQWGGGPFFGVGCGSEVSFSNEEAITRFDSSDWGQRGFCNQCGTHLFYFLKPAGQYFMPAGLFDVEDKLNFHHQYFIDLKPDYYAFANETQNMTEAEVMAAFAGEDGQE